MIRRFGAFGVFLAVILVLAGACGEKENWTTPPLPTAPTAASPPSSPTPSPGTYEMTGRITDEMGAPVPGATLKIWIDYVDVASAVTDASGAYKIAFAAGPPGSNYFPGLDPPNAVNAVAFANVEAP